MSSSKSGKTTVSEIINHQDRQLARDMSEELKKRITEFLDDNQGLFIVIADPDSDAVVAGYKEHLEAHRLVGLSTDESVSVVRDMLKSEHNDEKVKHARNQFLLLVDGSIHDIAKRLTGKGNKDRKVDTT